MRYLIQHRLSKEIIDTKETKSVKSCFLKQAADILNNTLLTIKTYVKDDSNGTPLFLGDKVDVYDWGHSKEFIGGGEIKWDKNEMKYIVGTLGIDSYDLWSKAKLIKKGF